MYLAAISLFDSCSSISFVMSLVTSKKVGWWVSSSFSLMQLPFKCCHCGCSLVPVFLLTVSSEVVVMRFLSSSALLIKA